MRTVSREIDLDGERFELTMNFQLQKSYSLTLTAPYRIRLNLPFFQREENGLRFLEEKKDWIFKKNDELLRKEESSFLYRGGEEIWFLGKRYQFVVLDGPDRLMISDDTICFYTNKKTEETVMKSFYAHSLDSLKAVCRDYSDDLLRFIRSKGYPRIPEIEYKLYKSRWGVCYPAKNKIILNSRLVHFPPECIYYVFLHELVHFLWPNHSRDFYRTLAEKMPDYKEVVSLLH